MGLTTKSEQKIGKADLIVFQSKSKRPFRVSLSVKRTAVVGSTPICNDFYFSRFRIATRSSFRRAMDNVKFLPLCDVLFNIISLLWYFCNIVFDLVLCYALYEHQKYVWFTACLSFIILSLSVNQIISLHRYFKTIEYRQKLNSKNFDLKR